MLIFLNSCYEVKKKKKKKLLPEKNPYPGQGYKTKINEMEGKTHKYIKFQDPE